MGYGEGRGDGMGEGAGEDTGTRVAAGSGVAVCCTVCFFCVGIPTIFIGIALVAIFKTGSIFVVGVILLVLSFLFLIVAIILVVAICTNCFGKGSKVEQTEGFVHRGGPQGGATTIQISQHQSQAPISPYPENRAYPS